MLLSKDLHLALLIARHCYVLRSTNHYVSNHTSILDLIDAIGNFQGQCIIFVRAIAQSSHPVMSNPPVHEFKHIGSFQKLE